MDIDISKYKEKLSSAIQIFWKVRNNQNLKQDQRKIQDTGNRGAVTGGKQLDGLLELLKEVAIDTGIPQNCIYTKGNSLPGYFRPTKDWDLLIISPNKKLISVVELKSQVGSFGNNFNNRTEESLGSAIDLWTAFRESAFPQQQAPWLGYLMLVEKTNKSTKLVKIREPHFKAFPEFEETSYLDRYRILGEKLMSERHYNHYSLIWTQEDSSYGDISEETSIESFLYSYIGHLLGKLNEFKG